uniref:Uncharacterized protein n=1 Tax=Schistocephalus solidus TaxID=70667 RepID=A0A0X3PF06_SCHSO
MGLCGEGGVYSGSIDSQRTRVWNLDLNKRHACAARENCASGLGIRIEDCCVFKHAAQSIFSVLSSSSGMQSAHTNEQYLRCATVLVNASAWMVILNLDILWVFWYREYGQGSKSRPDCLLAVASSSVLARELNRKAVASKKLI